MIDARINFRHIRCFLEVARLKSVSRAAQELNLAQSAVSRTLAELEGIVGVKLLIRNRRGSHLTRAGREFFDLAASGAAQIRQAYNLAERDSASPQTLSLGAVPSVSTVLLPRCLSDYQARNGNVTLRIVQAHNHALLDMLRAVELDFVLGRLVSMNAVAGLAFEHLFDERIDFFVHRDAAMATPFHGFDHVELVTEHGDGVGGAMRPGSRTVCPIPKR